MLNHDEKQTIIDYALSDGAEINGFYIIGDTHSMTERIEKPLRDFLSKAVDVLEPKDEDALRWGILPFGLRPDDKLYEYEYCLAMAKLRLKVGDMYISAFREAGGNLNKAPIARSIAKEKQSNEARIRHYTKKISRLGEGKKK
jgi:hypothetical protein